MDGVSSKYNIFDTENPPNPPESHCGYCALPGFPFLVEAGGAFSAGATLKTDGIGRAIAQGGTGTIVARALTAAAGSGSVVWAAFV